MSGSRITNQLRELCRELRPDYGEHTISPALHGFAFLATAQPTMLRNLMQAFEDDGYRCALLETGFVLPEHTALAEPEDSKPPLEFVARPSERQNERQNSEQEGRSDAVLTV